MLFRNTLQSKLLVSVCLIVTAVVVSVSALVIYVEKNRYQKEELERIYYMTDGMKKRLGHLMYGKNWRYLMITLANAKHSDMSILYFTVTGTNGKVLASDREEMIGRASFDLARRLKPDLPLYNRSSPAGAFRIFLASYADGKDGGAGEDETIFEAVHEINYLGQPMGQLVVGFSRKAMNRHLTVLSAGMLGTGLLVLAVIMALMVAVIRTHMVPVDSFIRQMSGLDLTSEGQSLRDSLATMPLKHRPGETRDVHRLKQAFEHLRDQFVMAWDQLEGHRNNLEKMVEQRTRDLDRQIRERKEIEARLLTVQKLEAIGTLAGGIAHEFNNLFMAITGYATLIQKRSEPGHDNIEKAEKIRQLVETGSQSVQQLLGFARSGKFAPGPLNLNEVVQGSLVILTRSRKGLDTETDLLPDLWIAHADRSQMEQVVMNLLLNASDAMPGTGTIAVTTQNLTLDEFQVSLETVVSGNFVCLTVADEGTGIAPELLPRIFDPFFTTKEMGMGSGMGLASVFGIVENHGGFITAESTPGEGSCFKVYLPAGV